MDIESKPQLSAFWQDFEAILIEQGVSRERVRWYVRWARMFEQFLSSRLEDRSETEVNAFLAHLKSEVNIKDWKVGQAADCLRILYQIFFDVPWAHEKTWPVQSAPGAVPFFRHVGNGDVLANGLCERCFCCNSRTSPRPSTLDSMPTSLHFQSCSKFSCANSPFPRICLTTRSPTPDIVL